MAPHIYTTVSPVLTVIISLLEVHEIHETNIAINICIIGYAAVRR